MYAADFSMVMLVSPLTAFLFPDLQMFLEAILTILLSLQWCAVTIIKLDGRNSLDLLPHCFPLCGVEKRKLGPENRARRTGAIGKGLEVRERVSKGEWTWDRWEKPGDNDRQKLKESSLWAKSRWKHWRPGCGTQDIDKTWRWRPRESAETAKVWKGLWHQSQCPGKKNSCKLGQGGVRQLGREWSSN